MIPTVCLVVTGIALARPQAIRNPVIAPCTITLTHGGDARRPHSPTRRYCVRPQEQDPRLVLRAP
jgi:hypothetical protein